CRAWGGAGSGDGNRGPGHGRGGVQQQSRATGAVQDAVASAPIYRHADGSGDDTGQDHRDPGVPG
ncbi:unnamed protein product, partial [Ectocarpus sp. 4 AP-2014]